MWLSFSITRISLPLAPVSYTHLDVYKRQGSYLATTEEKVRVPAIPVKTVDSTGAGDAFMGGLGYGLLQKWPLKRMGEFSNACGSYCCQEIGAQYLGDLQEILRFLRESGLNW